MQRLSEKAQMIPTKGRTLQSTGKQKYFWHFHNINLAKLQQITDIKRN